MWTFEIKIRVRKPWSARNLLEMLWSVTRNSIVEGKISLANPEVFQQPVGILGFTSAQVVALQRNGIHRIQQLVVLDEVSILPKLPSDLSVDEVKVKLRNLGLGLCMLQELTQESHEFSWKPDGEAG